jgi:hypothetical protein
MMIDAIDHRKRFLTNKASAHKGESAEQSRRKGWGSDSARGTDELELTRAVPETIPPETPEGPDLV